MTIRVAVATARYGDPWDELSVLAGRLAGALACTAEVDVLVPSPAPEVGWDGACRLLRFPALATDPRARVAWRKVVLGVEDPEGPGACTCPTTPGRGRLPELVEKQLVLAEGGDSPALYEHLQDTAYDATLFVGLHTPTTLFGARALPEDRRIFVVPGTNDVGNALAVHDPVLARAERILVCTEGERRRLADRVGSAERVENIGFLVGVNTVVRPESDPTASSKGERFVVAARDWRTPDALRHYNRWAAALAPRLPAEVSLRLVGPGASRLAAGVPRTDARIDAWWWMSRASAVIDPVPHRTVGQEILEAMLFAVPVVVAADGDATREHAETGNGGLWYRIDDELSASVARILNRDTDGGLGEQGRSYASERFGETDTYVKRVTEAVLG